MTSPFDDGCSSFLSATVILVRERERERVRVREREREREIGWPSPSHHQLLVMWQ